MPCRAIKNHGNALCALRATGYPAARASRILSKGLGFGGGDSCSQGLFPREPIHGKETQLGDIKSTIDLIMERTRGMTLSADERATLREEELGKRAKGFRLKLLEDPSRADEVLAALKDDSPEDKKLLETLIWKEIVENLPANLEILHHIDAMHALPQAQGKSRVLGELRSLFKGGMKSSAEDRKKIVAREKKKLAALGISGTAVIPKIPKETEASPELLSAINKFRKELLDQRTN